MSAGCVGALAVALLPVFAFGQNESGDKLTAREMFVAARQKAAARPAATLKAPPARVSAEAAKVTSPVSAAPVRTEPEVSTATTPPPPAEPAAPPKRRPEPLQGGAKVVLAGYSPLGIRYTLSKRDKDGSYSGVSPKAVFHSGDHIELGIEVSEPGYLYIVYQGSSGTWETLFPSPKIRGGDNRMDTGRSENVPLTFVGQPGVEKLFVIFSREPEADMDNWIYKMQGVSTSEPAKPKAASNTFLLTKAVPIDNAVVDKLRDVYSRDLIIEPVDEPAKPSRKQDQSVYVVNPKGAPDSHVVADIRLVHEE